MRLRNVPGAREMIIESSLSIQEPEEIERAVERRI